MDLICLCHLRWNFVYQRPQHLMSRFAQQFRVFYVEEPIYDADTPFLDTNHNEENVWVVVPHLPPGMAHDENIRTQQKLVSQLVQHFDIHNYIAWYYTPMAQEITTHLGKPLAIVYDCMDELSAFKNAPVELKEKEAELMSRANIVFTGGQSLYEAKKHLHPNIYPFPSSIDRAHFAQARQEGKDPLDQLAIAHPRIGFYGVIDERMDLELLETIATERAHWNLVLIGPVVKIDPASLPRRKNIHYLNGKTYAELPAYLRGWDVAILPFAINESTRFISPTKTPEYLAGGKPVVSTPIQDVVNPYGDNGLVYTGYDRQDFIKGIEWALGIKNNRTWNKAVDAFLENISWDKTWDKMMFHLNTIVQNNSDNNDNTIKKESAYV